LTERYLEELEERDFKVFVEKAWRNYSMSVSV